MKNIRTSKLSKIVASYLAIQLILTTVQPTAIFASTSGPSQPEFNSFTPIGTSDMVNLSTGDFNYNIPVMDVGGYPLNLSYDAGITMDQEASWVGLGWNLNVGQINRQIRGIPDDFKGDEMTYENNLKDNVTVGISAQIEAQILGLETEDAVVQTPTGTSFSAGMGIQYNNYHGITFKPSYGLAFDLGDYVNVGMDVETSAIEGATISPKINAKANLVSTNSINIDGSLNAGLSYNSSRGLTSFGLATSVSPTFSNSLVNDVLQYGNASTISGKLSFSQSPPITPRKRTAFKDFNSTFSFSTGLDATGIDGEIEISATAAVQKIKDETKTEKAYGYEFTGQATKHDVLDYNRENDRVISRNTLALPYTNYTYDLYTVNGQGINGMFRAHRSQIGKIYDEYVKDDTKSFSLGVEAEGGGGWHYGGNFVKAPSESYTGLWQTRASNSFKNENENSISTNLDYEPVYFKYVGENKVDNDPLFATRLKGDNAIAVKIGGTGFDTYADKQFREKKYQPNANIYNYVNESISEPLKRGNRDVRNQSIQKISVEELRNFYEGDYALKRINDNAKEHHTAEIRVLKPDGSTYVFGETAYNLEKQEVTFATDSNNYNCSTGIVTYNSGENSRDNKAGIDNFYNNVITPAYAHTYLLSTVLSSDYEDRTGNGPTNDDFGAYTLFEYTDAEELEPFQWRIPYGSMKASYNAGLNSNDADQKGSYIYGQKEIKYIKKIETKTHIAVFDISARKDGRGVLNKDGDRPNANGGEQELYKLNTIKLYSKPEYDAFKLLNADADDEPTTQEVSPIKTAHFEYDYSLCENTPNHSEYNTVTETGPGKLTLKNIYFTYRSSEMGRYTPYTFNYEKEFDIDGDGIMDLDNNLDYSLKANDIWGNYKSNEEGGCNTQDALTTSEYPFVDQQDKAVQDVYSAAWALTSIDLPSGGSIDLTYESDDYQYVQDKSTQQMFKVVGVGASDASNNNSTNPESSQFLYGVTGEAKYLYVELPDETDTSFNFEEKYLKDIEENPIYFRFLMNMTKKGAVNTSSKDYDYVTGYFDKDENRTIDVFENQGSIYAGIPMKWTPMEGGLNGNKDKNPITKAGLFFGRTYLNGIVYGLTMDSSSENIVTIAKKLAASISAVGQIFTGPNEKLREDEFLCAQRFIPEKSWIRLSTPKSYKLGGGSRIKQLVMDDHWDDMTEGGTRQIYGQTYDYTLESSGSSGVATFEPNNSAENPFVEPFYDKGERLIAPRELSYVEKPFGKAFFPHSKVTYSRVTVKNLERDDITRHATGKVISEFYTTKDFPTKVDYTDIDTRYESNQNDVLGNLIGGIFGIPVEVKNQFTLSQGYVIHTNDMDGKMRMQKVFQEGVEDPISTVEYKYSKKSGEENVLSNVLPVINKSGEVSTSEIAVDYDVITDFREAYSKSETVGVNTNVAAFFLGLPIIIPTAFPISTKHENIAHSVITTKTVHTTAVLKEKIATDLGATVSTVNEAWDAETGQVILTKTINEFDDAYYNFNFPAYWAYSGMGQASKNLGIRGTLDYAGGYFSLPTNNASTYLTLGDELMVSYGDTNKRLWVVEFNDNNTAVKLMDLFGAVQDDLDQESVDFKIIRSGYRNQQMGNMGAITMMKNPLVSDTGGLISTIDTSTFSQDVSTPAANSLRIINASAVKYNDFWNCQCESKLPYIPNASVDTDVLAETPIEDYEFNPYIYNVNGEWRAQKSYAYLTERVDVKNQETTKQNTRKEGYFKDFSPFYVSNSVQWDSIPNDATNGPWTFASEVTQYSPFGAEIENRDALNRYSSAQYGYNYTLPTAVASNSKYRSIGADNFEDYSGFLNTEDGHFNFKDIVDGDGDGGIAISTDQSHTGHSSLLVPNEHTAVKEVELLGVLANEDDFDGDGISNDDDNCPYTPNEDQYYYDEIGLGDKCDDEAYPKVTDVQRSHRLDEHCMRQKTFTINSTPNSIGSIRFLVIETPIARGRNNNPNWSVYLNDDFIGSKSDSPHEEVIPIVYDATGRYFAELEVRVQRKRRVSQRDLIIALEILDKYNNTVATELIDSQSYDTRGCHGKDYDTHKLFPFPNDD